MAISLNTVDFVITLLFNLLNLFTNLINIYQNQQMISQRKTLFSPPKRLLTTSGPSDVEKSMDRDMEVLRNTRQSTFVNDEVDEKHKAIDSYNESGH
jgi:hypothetical protein